MVSSGHSCLRVSRVPAEEAKRRDGGAIAWHDAPAYWSAAERRYASRGGHVLAEARVAVAVRIPSQRSHGALAVGELAFVIPAPEVDLAARRQRRKKGSRARRPPAAAERNNLYKEMFHETLGTGPTNLRKTHNRLGKIKTALK